MGELNTMWLKHIKSSESATATPSEMPSTPKKVVNILEKCERLILIIVPQFLGSLLENKTNNAVKLEEELMSTR